jgi:hypothetical protein
MKTNDLKLTSLPNLAHGIFASCMKRAIVPWVQGLPWHRPFSITPSEALSEHTSTTIGPELCVPTVYYKIGNSANKSTLLLGLVVYHGAQWAGSSMGGYASSSRFQQTQMPCMHPWAGRSCAGYCFVSPCRLFQTFRGHPTKNWSGVGRPSTDEALGPGMVVGGDRWGKQATINVWICMQMAALN